MVSGENLALPARGGAALDRPSRERRDFVPFAVVLKRRSDVREERLDHGRRGNGTHRVEVDELPVEAVSSRLPLGRAQQLGPHLGRWLPGDRGVVTCPGQAAGQPGDHHGLVQRHTDVGDAELDRLKTRRRANIPVDLRPVRDGPRRLERRDQIVEVGPGRERLRGARRRPTAPHLRPETRIPRVGPKPVGRVRSERQHHREPRAAAVHDLDRGVSIADPDVDVAAEDQLLAGELCVVLCHFYVARFGRHFLRAPVRERMRARGRDSASVALGRRDDLPAKSRELRTHLGDRSGDCGADLDLREVVLELHGVAHRILRGRQNQMRPREEFSRRRVDDLVLLFDTDREIVIRHKGMALALRSTRQASSACRSHVKRRAASSFRDPQPAATACRRRDFCNHRSGLGRFSRVD